MYEKNTGMVFEALRRHPDFIKFVPGNHEKIGPYVKATFSSELSAEQLGSNSRYLASLGFSGTKNQGVLFLQVSEDELARKYAHNFNDRKEPLTNHLRELNSDIFNMRAEEQDKLRASYKDAAAIVDGARSSVYSKEERKVTFSVTGDNKDELGVDITRLHPRQKEAVRELFTAWGFKQGDNPDIMTWKIGGKNITEKAAWKLSMSSDEYAVSKVLGEVLALQELNQINGENKRTGAEAKKALTDLAAFIGDDIIKNTPPEIERRNSFDGKAVLKFMKKSQEVEGERAKRTGGLDTLDTMVVSKPFEKLDIGDLLDPPAIRAAKLLGLPEDVIDRLKIAENLKITLLEQEKRGAFRKAEGLAYECVKGFLETDKHMGVIKAVANEVSTRGAQISERPQGVSGGYVRKYTLPSTNGRNEDGAVR